MFFLEFAQTNCEKLKLEEQNFSNPISHTWVLKLFLTLKSEDYKSRRTKILY